MLEAVLMNRVHLYGLRGDHHGGGHGNGRPRLSPPSCGGALHARKYAHSRKETDEPRAHFNNTRNAGSVREKNRHGGAMIYGEAGWPNQDLNSPGSSIAVVRTPEHETWRLPGIVSSETSYLMCLISVG